MRPFILALALLALAAPANAGTLDSPSCRHSLAAASARMGATLAQTKAAADRDATCAAYRSHFLEVVRARAVAANCKTGTERDQDLAKLDSTVDDVNSAIAERCGS